MASFIRFRIPAVALAAGLIVAATSSAGCDFAVAQEEARDHWSRSYTLTPGGTLDIRNTNGRIVIEPGEGATVEVTAERVARAVTQERAREALGEFEIRETASADRITIDSRSRGLNLRGNRVVHFTVKLPSSTNVTLSSTNGDIAVRGLTGELRIESTNGRIQGTDLGNGAVVETTNGAIVLEFASLGDQGIRCETTNGAITVRLPEEANAEIVARVRNGRVTTSDLDGRLSVREDSRRRFEARLGEGGPSVRLETTNGAIRLRGR